MTQQATMSGTLAALLGHDTPHHLMQLLEHDDQYYQVKAMLGTSAPARSARVQGRMHVEKTIALYKEKEKKKEEEKKKQQQQQMNDCQFVAVLISYETKKEWVEEHNHCIVDHIKGTSSVAENHAEGYCWNNVYANKDKLLILETGRVMLTFDMCEECAYMNCRAADFMALPKPKKVKTELM
uniref:CMP/dCMP-type deaminase domain-containing protein n=1 Tax=Globodera pallida TaxID=36090 RepID=A0A183CAS4_GLOPA